MAFIHPLFLFGAVALAGPILLHWLLRDRARRQMLPTLRLLPEAAPQSMRRRKLKDILLLTIRLLILALIVLGFARPHWGRSERPGSDSLPEEAAVFVLDVSLSMREGNRWEAAMNRLDAMVRTLPGRSRQALIAFDRSPRVTVPAGEDRTRIIQHARNLEPGWGSTDLASALRTAAELASRIDARRQRVYFISDFQATGLESVETPGSLPAGVEVIPFRVSERPASNSALIEAVEVESDRPGFRRIGVQIESFADNPIDGEAIVRRDNHDLDRKPVVLEGGRRQAIEFDLPLPEAREAPITIEWSATDALDDDNRIALVLEPRRPLPVTVVAHGPPEETNPYLRAALLACGKELAPRWTGWDGMTMLSPVDCPVVIACSGSRADQSTRQLERFVRAGGTAILFSPSDAQDPGPLASNLSLHGWQRLDRASGACRLASSGAQELLRTDSTGIPFDILGHPRVYAYLKAAAATAESARALALLDNGDPFLIEAPLGQGRVYLFTIEAAPASSDFVLRPTFAPFLYHLIRLAETQSRTKRLFTVGDALPQALREPASQMRLKSPSGRTIDRDVGTTSLDEPGVWRMERVGHEDWIMVARLDPRESDLRPLDEDQVASFIQPASGRIVASATRALLPGEPAASPEPDSPWRPWWYLLCAALALMALETLLASRTWR